MSAPPEDDDDSRRRRGNIAALIAIVVLALLGYWAFSAVERVPQVAASTKAAAAPRICENHA
jgi:hypothetical protein